MWSHCTWNRINLLLSRPGWKFVFDLTTNKYQPRQAQYNVYIDVDIASLPRSLLCVKEVYCIEDEGFF